MGSLIFSFTYLGKSCWLGLSYVLSFYWGHFVLWLLSLVMLRVEFGFWLYQFLGKQHGTHINMQGYRYFKLRKAFSKFYRRHSALLEKYSVSLKTLLQQGISEPELYGDLVYRFRKVVGKSNFSEQFSKLINRYKRIGYSLDIMGQTACLVVNPIIVDGYASLFNCTMAVRASDSMTASS